VRPPTATEQEWSRVNGILDLPLRKVGADTSVLEVAYRSFADACVALAGQGVAGAAGQDWPRTLRSAPLRGGVTIRDRGATVDCETARRGLVTRADALRADLAAVEKTAQSNHVAPEQWRRLLGTHGLEVWDGY
jgi:hypothetical protein